MIEGEILHSEGARETQEEQEILPEDFSEFFGDLKLAKGRLEFLEKEVNEFLTDEEISQEKLERLLGGIDGMEKEAEKLEEFFSKESFEQRVFKEYFYEDIKRDFRESTLRYSVEAIRGYQLDPLKRELGQGLEKLKGLEERAQKGKERMDDNRRETEESKEKILARASEIEKDLSGLIG
ncbi:MAG: hypothetical protein U9Q96_02775, partial [Patescibacteria group bacterium]|nr:hypothetical protein [Patescibacteria group bacterium]